METRRSPRHRTLHGVQSLAATLLTAVGVAACGGDSASTAPSPAGDTAGVAIVPWFEVHGRVVSREPVWMLPGRSWVRHPERRAWRATGSGSFRVYVVEPPDQPLIFGFVADPIEPPPECLVARWNGTDVTARLQRVEGDEIQLPIPPTELGRGDHELVVAHCPTDAETSLQPLVFRDLGFRRLPGGVVLDLEQLEHYRYLEDLRSRGVTGSLPTEKLSGIVFDGSRRAVVELPHDGGGRLAWTLHNSSHLDKTFVLTVGSESRRRTLAPHARERITIPVDAGVDRVTLATEGEDFGLGLWAAPTFDPPPGAPSPPSLVLITLDTTRRDLFATYGGAGLPHLDALARHATVYDDARTTAPWTLPSHASMFTGLYPSRHGAGVVQDHLGPELPTLAGRLRDQGYLTVGVAAGPLAGYLFGVARGFSVYVDPEGNERPADDVVRVVEEQLQRLVPGAGTPSPPVFLFVNLFDPHFPYQGSATPAPSLPDEWQQILGGDGLAWNRAVAGEVPLDPVALSELRHAYRADALAMDAAVGRLFEVLRRHRLLDEALLVVTADHGELLGEGGFLSHSGRLDPELLEVPLFVRQPGQRRGRRVAGLASVVDLYPTLLRTAGIEPRSGLDGIDLGAPAGAPSVDRFWVLAEEHHTPFHPLPPKMMLGPSALAFEGLHHRQVQSGAERSCFGGATGAWTPAGPPCPELDALAIDLRERLEAQALERGASSLELSDEERTRLEALGYL